MTTSECGGARRASFRLAALCRGLSAERVAAEAPDARTPVALILGAGAGIGQAVAAKFAMEGYHAVMVRRGAGPNRLLTEEDDSKRVMEELADTLRKEGGKATPIFADATSPEETAALVKRVEDEIGPIHFINYNIGAQVGNRPIDSTSYRIFELAWRMGSLGAFAIAKEAAPYMVKRGHGTIVYTSATSAVRGNSGQHAHAAAMGARRNLAQSLNHELGPKGIHVAHVVMDGVVNAPDTSIRLMSRMDKNFDKVVAKKMEKQEILEPVPIADTYFHLHVQPRSVWTLELDMRPWTTTPWFNS